MHRRGDPRQVGGDVVLETLLANKAQQPLHPANFDDARAAATVFAANVGVQ